MATAVSLRDRRSDVLIDAEQIRRVEDCLQAREPFVILPVRLAQAAALVIPEDVAVNTAGRPWLYGGPELPRPGEMYRLLGTCLLAQNQDGAAVEYLHRALHLARLQHARTFELRAAVTLAQCEPEEGRALVRQVLATFPDPQPWHDIVEAAALSRE